MEVPGKEELGKTTPPSNDPSHNSYKGRNLRLLFPAAGVALLLIAIGLGLILQRRKTDSPKGSLKTGQNETVARGNLVPLSLLDQKYLLRLNGQWAVTILENGKLHSLVSLGLREKGKAEVEAFSRKMKGWEKFLEDPSREVKNATKRQIGGKEVSVSEGVKKVGSLKWLFVEGRWDESDSVLFVRSYSARSEEAASLFEELAETVKTEENLTKPSSLLKVSTVFAEGDDTPENLKDLPIKTIEVMKPYEGETISESDPSYKDGYAKGYRFFAYKGQRLEVEAKEKEGVGSYLTTDLYNSLGEILVAYRGTSLKFRAPYSGNYYLVVYTFAKKVGPITILGIIDSDQTEIRKNVVYADGGTFLLDPEVPYGSSIGEFETSGVALQSPAPISVEGNRITIHKEKVNSLDTAFNLSDLYSKALILDWRYKEREWFAVNTANGDVSAKVLEIPLKVTRINTNSVLVGPAEGTFPAGKRIDYLVSGSEAYIYSSQDNSAPLVPVVRELASRYCLAFVHESSLDCENYNSVAVRLYFDWLDQDGAKHEVVGARLLGLNPTSVVPLPDLAASFDGLRKKVNDFFLEKGYEADEQNSFKDKHWVEGNDPSEVFSGTAFRKGNAVCKVRRGYGLDLYCGTLSAAPSVSVTPPEITPGTTHYPTASLTPSPVEEPLISLPNMRELLVVLGGNSGDDSQNAGSETNSVEAFDPTLGSWKDLPPMIYPHSGQAAVTLGDKIYVFGQAAKGRSMANNSEMFDSATAKWSEIPAPPDPKTNVPFYQAFPWGDRIILIYGRADEANNFKNISYAYSFDVKTYEYLLLSSPNVWLHYCFTQNRKIFCTSSEDSVYMYEFSPRENKWEKKPIENRQSSISNFGDNGYTALVLSQDNYGDRYLYRFNINSSRYEPLGVRFSPSVGKIFGYTLGYFGNPLIVGGQLDEAGHYRARREVYAYPYNYTFSKLPSMNTSRAGAAVVSLPFPPSSSKGSIKGKVVTGSSKDKISTQTRVVLEKIAFKNPDGGQTVMGVATYNVDSSGEFAFYGLEEGEYELYTGGDYNSFSNINWQNPIKLNVGQRLENLEIQAFP